MKEISLSNSTLGQINVSEDVIKSIVEHEVCYVVGVKNNDYKNVLDKLVSSLRSKTKVVFEEDGSVVLNVPIRVIYGTNIATVAYQVQEKIQGTLLSMVGIDNAEVNIYVEGLVFLD